MLSARGNKYSVHHTIHFRAAKCSEVLVSETSLQPFHFTSLDALGKTIVKGGIFRGE